MGRSGLYLPYCVRIFYLIIILLQSFGAQAVSGLCPTASMVIEPMIDHDDNLRRRDKKSR
jgi:hypothetical protein